MESTASAKKNWLRPAYLFMHAGPLKMHLLPRARPRAKDGWMLEEGRGEGGRTTEAKVETCGHGLGRDEDTGRNESIRKIE